MKLLSCSGGCGGSVYAESNVESATCDPCNGIFPVGALEGDALTAFLAEQKASQAALEATVAALRGARDTEDAKRKAEAAEKEVQARIDAAVVDALRQKEQELAAKDAKQKAIAKQAEDSKATNAKPMAAEKDKAKA